MKKLLTILISLCVLTFIGCAQVKTDPVVVTYLSGLLEGKNFFKLRMELTNAQDKLSEDRLLYYQMYYEQAFGNGLQSNKSADKLLKKYKDRLNDTVVVEILNVKADNYVRDYQYKQAAEVYNLLLNMASDSLEIAAYQNVQALYGTYQMGEIHVRKDGTIFIPQEPGNRHLENMFLHGLNPVVQLLSGSDTLLLTFDTGARSSELSKKYYEILNPTFMRGLNLQFANSPTSGRRITGKP